MSSTGRRSNAIFSFIFFIMLGMLTNWVNSIFFSPTSFHPNELKDWPVFYNSCQSNPPLMSVPKSINMPLLQQLIKLTENPPDPRTSENFRLAAVLNNKIPTPIDLTPGPLVTLKNVTFSERTLFFEAKPPTDEFYVSYYMNRTGFPFHGQGSQENDFKLNNQIEYSFARALSVSINRNQENRFAVFGLGENDNAGNRHRRFNEQHFYFVNAVFLGGSADNPKNFASHVLPGNKRYPMEIYMYFSNPDCQLPECSIQVVVLVEESKEDNKLIGSLIATAKTLYDEEIRFIEKYKVKGLLGYAERIYNHTNKRLLDMSNYIHYNFERIHMAQFHKINASDIFQKLVSVGKQGGFAKAKMYETHPHISATEQFTQELGIGTVGSNANAYNVCAQMINESLTTVEVLVTTLVSDAGNNLYNDSEYNAAVNGTNRTLWSIIDEMDICYLKLLSIDREKNYPGTRVPSPDQLQILKTPKTVGNITANVTPFERLKLHSSVTTSYLQNQIAVRAYATYYVEVVIKKTKDLTEYAKRMSKKLTLNAWHETVSFHPDYFLTGLRQLMELEDYDVSFKSISKVRIHGEARDRVPRLKLKEKFQVSWLIPNHGGHYRYSGSTPFPPCHQLTETVVFENPIQMSRKQIEILTTIPRGKGVGPLNGTRPRFHLVKDIGRNITIKYNLKNHQWVGEGDGLHEDSRARAKRKRGGSPPTATSTSGSFLFVLLSNSLFFLIYYY